MPEALSQPQQQQSVLVSKAAEVPQQAPFSLQQAPMTLKQAPMTLKQAPMTLARRWSLGLHMRLQMHCNLFGQI